MLQAICGYFNWERDRLAGVVEVDLVTTANCLVFSLFVNHSMLAIYRLPLTSDRLVVFGMS